MSPSIPTSDTKGLTHGCKTSDSQASEEAELPRSIHRTRLTESRLDGVRSFSSDKRSSR
jgi:hypothetical protein